jgi:hypothetical protein
MERCSFEDISKIVHLLSDRSSIISCLFVGINRYFPEILIYSYYRCYAHFIGASIRVNVYYFHFKK